MKISDLEFVWHASLKLDALDFEATHTGLVAKRTLERMIEPGVGLVLANTREQFEQLKNDKLRLLIAVVKKPQETGA